MLNPSPMRAMLNCRSTPSNPLKPSAFIPFAICAALLTGCNPSPDLEREISAIDAQLDELPILQPNMLCPTVGFASTIFQGPDHTSWLDIILDEPRQLDTIVLVPALLKNKTGTLETLGFPIRFTIEAWEDETPGTQHARLWNGGWLYQPIGIYDPGKHPEALLYELSLQQTVGVGSSAPVSVSLHYARAFEPSSGRDVHHAPGVTLVEEAHTHPLPTKTGKHGPQRVSGRFGLRSVPAGATLYFRIANKTQNQVVSVDDIKLNSPFDLENGDFEAPSLHPKAIKQHVTGWFQQPSVTHRGTYWAEATYRAGRVLVDFSEKDYPNPGIAPVVFTFPPDTVATKVRIRALRLQQEISWRQSGTGHNFALNEVLLFDGLQNVALNSRTAASDQNNFALMFRLAYAVDGYSYYPPVDPRQISSPEIEPIHNETVGQLLMFDLSRSYALDEARFYPVDRSPQFSHRFALGVGFPRNISLRVGIHPDPAKARKILGVKTEYQVGADPVLRRLNQDSGRYVWLEMKDGQYDPRTGREALGLSEIEILQNGTNVLAGIQPVASSGAKRKLPHLTDGRTSSGIIVPQKEWLLSLHHRSNLEREKSDLLLQQQDWIQHQRHLTQARKAALIAVVLATLLFALLVQVRHRRNLRRLRENIGANLHDSVGANLSGIALASEMLKHSGQLNSPHTRKLIDDITRIAQETATEIRLFSRFLEKQGAKSNLVGQLRRIEQQMLPALRTESEFNAPELFNALSPTEKWELVLFFKEALHNIVKHANATRVEIRTRAEGKQLYLEITDNGQGFPDDSPPPVHLIKRAQKLHGELNISSSKDTGSTLQLAIPKKGKK